MSLNSHINIFMKNIWLQLPRLSHTELKFIHQNYSQPLKIELSIYLLIKACSEKFIDDFYHIEFSILI